MLTQHHSSHAKPPNLLNAIAVAAIPSDEASHLRCLFKDEEASHLRCIFPVDGTVH